MQGFPLDWMRAHLIEPRNALALAKLWDNPFWHSVLPIAALLLISAIFWHFVTIRELRVSNVHVLASDSLPVAAAASFLTRALKRHKHRDKGCAKSRASSATKVDTEGEVEVARQQWEDAGADTFLLQPDMATHGLVMAEGKHQRPRSLHPPRPPFDDYLSAASADEAADGIYCRGAEGTPRVGSKSLDGQNPTPSAGSWMHRVESCSSLTASSMAMSAQQSSIAVSEINSL